MPTYPHYRPGDPMPNDKILIYEDTNNDGKADKETVFADHLHLPIGIEFAPEGVYIAQQPHFMLLRDTNGDDQADSSEIIFSGFDTTDTHHSASAYVADPSGAILMGEGYFLHSNIETPYGPKRGVEGGLWRFNSKRCQLERSTQFLISNPWGIAFDDWGQDFILDTSSQLLFWVMPSSIKPHYGARAPFSKNLTPNEHAVRPTSGLEIVSSRHFPDEVQGDILLCNSIGFRGIKQHSITDDGTGYKTAFRQDLLRSNDGNFRPVDLEFAPDGSLYVIDWHNVLVGHMQHNARDPLRDHMHGRIYRITYPSRPLVKPAEVANAPIATLLENLKLPEYRTRYRTRRELRAHPAAMVMPVLKQWVANLDPKDARYDHHITEALWVSWGLSETDESLLHLVLQSKDFRARAAGVRLIRHCFDRIPSHKNLLEKTATDPHGRVRLETIIAASWLDNDDGRNIASLVSNQPQDDWMFDTIEVTSNRLAGIKDSGLVKVPTPPAPAHLDMDEQLQFEKGHEIYHRDAHCATCHQTNGNGSPPAFPPLSDSPWVTGDPERLIKLTLHGLMGPLEIKSVKYDGLVPMTPFGGILRDDQIAAVLTYVRNSFGNQASAIRTEDVKKVRAATKDQKSFFLVEELLKAHPMN